VTRIVLDEEGVQRLLARLSDPATGPAAEKLQPIRDADDLHEVDLDAELWNRLPALPGAPDHS
jgi:hypothetical protein